MIDIGEISCDGLNVRVGNGGKTVYYGRHRSCRDAVERGDAIA